MWLNALPVFDRCKADSTLMIFTCGDFYAWLYWIFCIDWRFTDVKPPSVILRRRLYGHIITKGQRTH